jgi:hypothetical protein
MEVSQISQWKSLLLCVIPHLEHGLHLLWAAWLYQGCRKEGAGLSVHAMETNFLDFCKTMEMIRSCHKNLERKGKSSTFYKWARQNKLMCIVCKKIVASGNSGNKNIEWSFVGVLFSSSDFYYILTSFQVMFPVIITNLKWMHEALIEIKRRKI